ncbi:MAG: type I polyketide synthase [Acidobacteriota bacterium]
MYENIEQLSPSKRALLALKEIEVKLEALEQAKSAPIAIIGMSCRFPGQVNSSEAFWQLLAKGVDAVQEIPKCRWNADTYYDPDTTMAGKMNTRWGGFLDQIDLFDASFFGISPREATYMDPQQRLLLEVVWEALEDAGKTTNRLSGSLTGVFVGVANMDYTTMMCSALNQVNAYTASGGAFSIIANRISYLLDLRGPSISIDTACSSSLVAVHLACQSLRNKECDMALAAGVNLILSPAATISFSKAQMMAADGRCKTFDHRADGFVRGEGSGVIVLKRLSDAIADGDNILATIRGSAINQDGRSAGLTAPNLVAQQMVLKQALHNARVEPWQVSYIEAHGTGTSLGDPIEVEALTSVYGQLRQRDQVCFIGAVKTNIGHLEAASGIAGLIKTVLCLQHKQIPANLHFKKLNPNISLDNMAFVLPTELQPWPVYTQEHRYAGISSFGFGGTNVHMILQEWTGAEMAEQEPVEEKSFLMPISAKSAEALEDLASAYINFLTSHPTSLKSICYNASLKRPHHNYRLAIAATTKQELTVRLNSFLEQQPTPFLSVGDRDPNQENRLVWVFPGQGPQWQEINSELLEKEPIFRAKIVECDQILRQYVDWSLLEQLAAEPAYSRLQQTSIAQLAVVVTEIALAELWRSYGVVADAVVGHSVGEIAAAYVAGVFSLEDAIKIVFHRGRLMEHFRGQGKTVAVGLPLEEVKILLAQYDDKLSIAAHNGPHSTTVSGVATALQQLIDKLQEKGVRCSVLNNYYAFHNPQMHLLKGEFEQSIVGINAQNNSIAIYSTVTGKEIAGQQMQAKYWTNNLIKPVLFAPAIEQLIEQDYLLYLELSPEPILSSSILQCLKQSGKDGKVLPSLRKNQPARLVMLDSIGRLYCAGNMVDWEKLYVDKTEFVKLPNYPWQRQRFWLEESNSEPYHFPTLQAQKDLRDHFYQLQWHAKPLLDREQRSTRSWLIYSPKLDLTTALVNLLQEYNEEYRLVLDHFSYLSAIAERSKSSKQLNIVFLAGLNLTTADLAAEGLLQSQGLACASLLTVIQDLAKTTAWDQAKIWIVTSGAQSVKDNTVNIAQSALWGFGCALAQEHPALWGGLIDLDPAQDRTVSAQLLIKEIMLSEGEDQIAYRGLDRYVVRLLPKEDLPEEKPIKWHSESAYLITGGLGGLALLLAKWMVAQGVRHIILISRTELPPRSLWQQASVRSQFQTQITAIEEMQSTNAQIYTAALDIANEADLHAFLQQFRSAHNLPIRGVFHLAGLEQTKRLLELQIEELHNILRPKVVGSWLLQCLLKDEPLEMFVLFSSVTSIIGAFGQGRASYAAANAFLDGLAHYRRTQGQTALSINWGLWAEVGLGAKQNLPELLALRGIQDIKPQQGLLLLERLMRVKQTQLSVLKMDWKLFFSSFRAVPLLSLIAEQHRERQDEQSLRKRLQGIILGRERQVVLENFIKEELSQVLRLPAASIANDTLISSLGFDSIMAVELRDRLETKCSVSLSTTLVWNYPTVTEIAIHLAERMQISLESSVNGKTTQFLDIGESLLEKIERLTDAEAATLLYQRLAELE